MKVGELKKAKERFLMLFQGQQEKNPFSMCCWIFNFLIEAEENQLELSQSKSADKFLKWFKWFKENCPDSFTGEEKMFLKHFGLKIFEVAEENQEPGYHDVEKFYRDEPEPEKEENCLNCLSIRAGECGNTESEVFGRKRTNQNYCPLWESQYRNLNKPQEIEVGDEVEFLVRGVIEKGSDDEWMVVCKDGRNRFIDKSFPVKLIHRNK